MSISLFATAFDHYHSFSALIWWFILRCFHTSFVSEPFSHCIWFVGLFRQTPRDFIHQLNSSESHPLFHSGRHILHNISSSSRFIFAGLCRIWFPLRPGPGPLLEKPALLFILLTISQDCPPYKILLIFCAQNIKKVHILYLKLGFIWLCFLRLFDFLASLAQNLPRAIGQNKFPLWIYQ